MEERRGKEEERRKRKEGKKENRKTTWQISNGTWEWHGWEVLPARSLPSGLRMGQGGSQRKNQSQLVPEGREWMERHGSNGILEVCLNGF